MSKLPRYVSPPITEPMLTSTVPFNSVSVDITFEVSAYGAAGQRFFSAMKATLVAGDFTGPHVEGFALQQSPWSGGVAPLHGAIDAMARIFEARPLCWMSRAYRHSRHRGCPPCAGDVDFLGASHGDQQESQGRPQARTFFQYCIVWFSLALQSSVRHLRFATESGSDYWSAVPVPGRPSGWPAEAESRCRASVTGPSELSGLSNSASLPTTSTAIWFL